MTEKGKKNRVIMIGAAAVVLLAAGIAAYFVFFKASHDPADDLPPIIKQVIKLNEDIKKTTIDLYNASGKLDSVSMVQSRTTDIASAIRQIELIREMVKKNHEEIDKLIYFIEQHETFFKRKNLEWIFAIKAFYSNPVVGDHHKSRINYLNAFETLLTYTQDNFENIMEHKSQQHMKSYDVYYLRYRRAADAHNRVNKKRIAFQNKFVQDHPEVSSFLPGSHHLESFKFWDKFSF